MKNYRSAFFLALAGNVVLVAALTLFWWRSHSPAQELKLEKLRSLLPAVLRPRPRTRLQHRRPRHLCPRSPRWRPFSYRRSVCKASA